MKIAMVSDRVYPYFKGGAEKRAWDLLQKLKNKGYEFHFYTGQWKGMKQNEINNGIYLHSVYKVKDFYVNGKKSIKESIKYSSAIIPALLKADYDLIEADQMPLMHIIPLKIISLIKNKPLIVTWHEVWGRDYWVKYIGNKGIIGAMIEKIAARLPNKIIAVSPTTKKRLIHMLNVNPKKITVIPNAVDIEKINKIKPSKEKSDIIYAGRLLSHKNVDLLINAIAILKKNNPKISCLIVGDGPERLRLEKLVKYQKLEKNIKFTGFMKSDTDVYAYMKSSKVFVLPSEREGFGIVVLEANAAGIPVVTVSHKDNAAQYLIEEGKNGFIANLELKSLASNVQKALKNYKSMKKVCIQSVQPYDLKSLLPRLEEVYRK